MSICKQWKICVLLKNEYIFLKKTKYRHETFTHDVFRLNQKTWQMGVASVTRTS